jgi:hypothetical protein
VSLVAFGGGVLILRAASPIDRPDVISALFQQHWEVGRLPGEPGAGRQLTVDSRQETVTYATYT